MFEFYGYASAGADYYAPLHHTADTGHRYIPSGTSDEWTSHSHDIWTVWKTSDRSVSDQGWNIHRSVRFERADAALGAFARTCFAEHAPFKHNSAELSFVFLHHKHGPRTQAGKFFVTYPGGEHAVRHLLNLLTEALAGEEGPYVVTDRRSRDSRTVHPRDGAFDARRRLLSNGTREWRMRDGFGRDIVDVRRAAFVLPDGISGPIRRPVHRYTPGLCSAARPRDRPCPAAQQRWRHLRG